MNSRAWIILGGLVALMPCGAIGQNAVITSIQRNGRMTWTNTLNTNAVYRREWASQAGGPWHAFTYQPLVDAHTSTSFEAEVPVFYRVVMATNPPPQGMLWIDGGDAEIGQTGIETPVHTNFISGFWMDEMEVTKAKWDEVAGWAATNGYDITAGGGSGKTNNHPVQEVSWHEAVKWCNARSQKEGLRPCYYIDPFFFNPYTTGFLTLSNEWVHWNSGGYRLPTEAEWEKAARGGRQRRLFPWGEDTIQHARANYFAATNSYAYDTSLTQGYHPNYQEGGFPYTSPVGSFPANGYGLHDMVGNVLEWCWDWGGGYVAGYATDPRGPASGTYRVKRGGSWGRNASFAPCAGRYIGPGSEDVDLGFRCARGPG